MTRSHPDTLAQDREALPELLDETRKEAVRFLEELDERPAGFRVPAIHPLGLPEKGLGAMGALEQLRERYGPWMSASAGPRYFAFVTGGATPASIVGDWLTSSYDQNASDGGESGARQLALDALGMFRSLLGLPNSFEGAFVTGATASSTVALAMARQWLGRHRGIDVSIDGLARLGRVIVLSGTPHSSIAKALSIVGLGRSALRTVGTLPHREAVDPEALAEALKEVDREEDGPAVVVANAGTVNTCDFDDLAVIANLKKRHNFWLHVDGAFGAIAAASPRYRSLLRGLEEANSITVDAHKWLNVPYDGAVVLSQHLGLQGEVFRSAGAYLPLKVSNDTLIHLTPENSQRLRALPAWMTMAAYGRAGYGAIVERCCDLASWLGARIEEDHHFKLLAPVRLNGVCFSLVGPDGPSERGTSAFLERLRDGGVTFLTPTSWDGKPAIRVSITNWRTTQRDVERVWSAIKEAASH